MMHLFTVGANHTTAPVAIREHFSFQNEILGHTLHNLTTQDANGVKISEEAMILSTCNRTELYCSTDNPQKIVEWLAQCHQLQLEHIQPYIYTLQQQDTVRHAFRVAAGLDSIVLGEPQILGQMKQAVRIAEHAGTLGTLLHRLFQHTFATAKEVRTNTDIGACSTSLATASVRLAQRVFGNLQGLKILFIGAGEMIELCAEHFATQKPAAITIANRTAEHGAALAKKVGGTSILLADLPGRLADFDIIVTSTASQFPIVSLDMLKHATQVCKRRPLFIVDLAVPRDIEPEAGALDGIFLYTMDDLAQVVQEGLGNRQEAVTKAEAIIDMQVENYMHWLHTRNAVPVIRALREQAENLRRSELEKAQRLLARGKAPTAVLETLSNALTNKLLHHPSHALNSSKKHDHVQFETLLRELYQI